MSEFPPVGFVEIESKLDGVQVFAPAPDVQKHEKVVAFRCPQCSGETAFNAADGGITCGYCGYHEAPEANIVGDSAETFEFKVETMRQASHGWGTERQEIVCQTCKSHITVEPDQLTTSCPFCQSNKVLQHKAPQDVLRPRFLIPFKISDADAHDRVRDWLGASWLVPKPLKQLASIGEFSPMFMPYWTFDAGTNATWSADVAHTVTRTVNGKSVTETEWRHESGAVQHQFKNIRVSGCDRLNKAQLKKISDFDLSGLTVYDASFLAGMQAVAYERDLETSFAAARHTMRDRIKQRCRNQASSSRMRNFNMKLGFSDESWRYVLLPIYVASYYYQNEPYQLLVNGQTGTLSGQRPADWRKVIVTSLIPLMLGAILLLWQEFVQRSDSNVLLIAAAACFLAGIAIAITLAVLAGGLKDA